MAVEAVGACVAALRQASQLLARRPLPKAPNGIHGLGSAVRAMDSQLFLIRHLLVLREQTAVLEGIEAQEAAPARPPAAGAPHGGLPVGFWAQSAKATRKMQTKRSRLLEDELSNACGELLEALSAWVSRPLLLHRARQAGGGDSSMEAAKIGFADNLRTCIPLIIAHFRIFLSEAAVNAASREDRGAGSAQVLLAPLRARLLAVWQAEPPVGAGASSHREADNCCALLDRLLAEAAEMSWPQLRELVLQAPRAAAMGGAAIAPIGEVHTRGTASPAAAVHAPEEAASVQPMAFMASAHVAAQVEACHGGPAGSLPPMYSVPVEVSG